MTNLRIALIAGSALLALGGIAKADGGYRATVDQGAPFTDQGSGAKWTPSANLGSARADAGAMTMELGNSSAGACFVTVSKVSQQGHHVDGTEVINLCNDPGQPRP